MARAQAPSDAPAPPDARARSESRSNELGRREARSGAGAEPARDPLFYADYDDGFAIRPFDKEKTPFALRINGRMQFRHTVFLRDASEWTDNAGEVRPIRNRNGFEIERGRLAFRGFFLDPNLQFYFNLDSDTDDSHRVIFHDFWINYAFGRAFDLHLGKAFVPGSRDWLNGSSRTRFSDRSMATTFFRPDRSLGIWAIGEPVDQLFYRIMIGNGFSTSDLTPAEIDTHFVYSGSFWASLGDYGKGYSDLAWHGQAAARIGNSFTFARSGRRDDSEVPLAESNFVRLSDGTRLTQPDALASGVTVERFDVYLYAADAAFKYRGFSANGEYFFRWVEGIRGDDELQKARFFDHGFYAAIGYFVVAERLEINARVSQIFGEHGDAQEYAGGINWFVDGTHLWKLTLDVAWLNRNAASNSGPNLRAGDDGVMVRSQLQAGF